MQAEYQALALMTLFFVLAWLPASLGKFKTLGARWALSNRNKPIVEKDLPPWAARADRAYNNLKDYFPAFVVAVLLLGTLGKFDEGTKWAASVYVVARLTHFASYTAGNVPVRGLSFLTGLFANIYLLIKILI